MYQGTKWVPFVKKKPRGWKSHETLSLREPQFCFKLCWQNFVRPKILTRFLQDSRDKISIDSRESCYEISVCYEICLRDSQEASLAAKFLSARLVRSESHYEISVCENCEKRVLLIILTLESCENFGSKKWVSLLARIPKSDSRDIPKCSSGDRRVA
jgi:hypothetical protein